MVHLKINSLENFLLLFCYLKMNSIRKIFHFVILDIAATFRTHSEIFYTKYKVNCNFFIIFLHNREDAIIIAT